MEENRRDIYTPQPDAPLSFDPRTAKRSRAFPFVLAVSCLALIGLMITLFFLYRLGLHPSDTTPKAVGNTVESYKALPPSDVNSNLDIADLTANSPDQSPARLARNGEQPILRPNFEASSPGLNASDPPPAGPQNKPSQNGAGTDAKVTGMISPAAADLPSIQTSPQTSTSNLVAGDSKTTPSPKETGLQKSDRDMPVTTAKPLKNTSETSAKPASLNPDKSQTTDSVIAMLDHKTLTDPKSAAVKPTPSSALSHSQSENLKPPQQQSLASKTSGLKPQTVASTPKASVSNLKTTSGKSEITVQIGAYLSEDQAKSGWQTVAGLMKTDMVGRGLHIEAVTVNNQTRYRSQITGFSNKDKAKAFCTQLKTKGHTCFVKSAP